MRRNASLTEQWRWEKEDQSLGRFFPKGPDWVGVFASMLVGLSKGPQVSGIRC